MREVFRWDTPHTEEFWKWAYKVQERVAEREGKTWCSVQGSTQQALPSYTRPHLNVISCDSVSNLRLFAFWWEGSTTPSPLLPTCTVSLRLQRTFIQLIPHALIYIIWKQWPDVLPNIKVLLHYTVGNLGCLCAKMLSPEASSLM